MFNLSGTELVFLVVIALVVLGPEKLPEAVRSVAKMYGELRKMTTGFQSELRSALDEPMKEMRATADALRKSVDAEAIGGGAQPAADATQPPAAAQEPPSITEEPPADDAGESATA